MVVRQPRYSKEEFARRGDEIYESQDIEINGAETEPLLRMSLLREYRLLIENTAGGIVTIELL